MYFKQSFPQSVRLGYIRLILEGNCCSFGGETASGRETVKIEDREGSHRANTEPVGPKGVTEQGFADLPALDDQDEFSGSGTYWENTTLGVPVNLILPMP